MNKTQVFVLYIAAGAVACAGATELKIRADAGPLRRDAIAELVIENAPRFAARDVIVFVRGVPAPVESTGEGKVWFRVPRAAPGPADVAVVLAPRGGSELLYGSAAVSIAGMQANPWNERAAMAIVLLVVLGAAGVLYLSTCKLNANGWNKVAFLFYDDKTNSYSVKQLQAVLWFFTILPVVIYAFVLTRLQTGAGAWVNLPQNVLYLLGTSAVTAVAADTIEKMHGTTPAKTRTRTASWRDLFVENETFSFARFQIVCWTVVSCAFYLSTYVVKARTDPTIIPDIPLTFWLLMGFSAATYVGSKITTTAGGAPQILSAVLSPRRDELVVRTRDIDLRFDMTPEAWLILTGTKDGRSISFPVGTESMRTQQLDSRTWRHLLPLSNGAVPDARSRAHELDWDAGAKIRVANPDGQVSADVPLLVFKQEGAMDGDDAGSAKQRLTRRAKTVTHGPDAEADSLSDRRAFAASPAARDKKIDHNDDGRDDDAR